eukprot:753705-Hanusia_phi.AAC.1
MTVSAFRARRPRGCTLSARCGAAGWQWVGIGSDGQAHCQYLNSGTIGEVLKDSNCLSSPAYYGREEHTTTELTV